VEESTRKTSQEKIGCLPYVLGGLSFIPLIGVLFGIIVIVWGVIKIKIGGWTLILVGSAGIALTIFLYGSLYYEAFVERGGTFDDLRAKLAQTTVTDLVKHIEYYKIQNGVYPDALEKLLPEQVNEQQPPSGFISIYDPTNVDGEGSETFYYELINQGQNYYLFSSGMDKQPFTNDDIHPVITENESAKIGYRRKNG